MDFKHVYTSSKTYIILLIVALGLLVFTASITYLQILNMQKSSELVKHTLQVYNAIGDLTTHYSQAESEEFREELLKQEVLEWLLKIIGKKARPFLIA